MSVRGVLLSQLAARLRGSRSASWCAQREKAGVVDQRIVFDKFHVVKQLHEAVDRVRRAKHRALKGIGDERLTGEVRSVGVETKRRRCSLRVNTNPNRGR